MTQDTRSPVNGTVSNLSSIPHPHLHNKYDTPNHLPSQKGIPKIFSKSETLKTEIVESKPDRIIFKLQQAYTPKVAHLTKPVNSLVTLTLDEQGKIKYHKDMWNSKDYSHEGLGKIMKTLNGDQLTKVRFDILCYYFENCVWFLCILLMKMW